MSLALPTGTVTFLFTDIEGSTRLLQHLGETYAQVRAEHHRLLRQAFGEYGGVEVDTQGDSFFVAFPLATAATAAAAAATRALAAYPWPEGGTVRVRMGLHTGVGMPADGHYVGLDVHRAARIAAAGHGGQILLSPTTRELVAHHLPAGATLRDLGTYRLKDLPQPERLYQLVLPDLPADFRPLKTLDSRPYALPPRASGFLGREEEQRVLTAALHSTQAVAVVGLGGLGKSSLAAEVTHTLASDPASFPGGVAWVRCDERTGLEGLIWILDQLLAAWEASLPAEATARVVSLEDGLQLRERALQKRLLPAPVTDPAPALVLLDNVEAALSLDRLVATLQPLGVTMLATMRTEPASPQVRLVRPQVLPIEAGVDLFAERYQGRGGTWETERDTTASAAIVQALGGLPLAIELAAARAARTQVPLTTLAAELRSSEVLTQLHDPLDASVSVRYSLSKTLSALTQEQRTAFAVLGLPDGPDWPLPVIVRMVEAVDRMSVLGTARETVEELVSYSMVSLLADDRGQRVRLHPLVRELARQELAQCRPEVQQAALRGLLAGLQDWVGAHQHEYEVLALEVACIVGAFRAACKQRIDLAHAYKLLALIDDYLINRDIALRQDLELLQLETAREQGDPAGEFAALRQLMSSANWLGHPEVIQDYVRQALALARVSQDTALQISLLTWNADDARHRGALDEGRRLFDEACALLATQELTDIVPSQRANLLISMGGLSAAFGLLSEGVAWCQQALDIARSSADAVAEGLALHNLGNISTLRGDYLEARHFHEEEQAIWQGAGSALGIGVTLDNLGEIAMRLGEFAIAADCFQQALEQFVSINQAQMQEHVLGNLAVLQGDIARTQGNRDEAGQHYQAALAIFAQDHGFEPANHITRDYAEYASSNLASLGTGTEQAAASAGASASTAQQSRSRRWWPWQRRTADR
jgi:class 3 adenylate cyclase/tetratricopeptide (TPR) repeat protein